jgi:hypothetical protein
MTLSRSQECFTGLLSLLETNYKRFCNGILVSQFTQSIFPFTSVKCDILKKKSRTEQQPSRTAQVKHGQMIRISY